MFAHSSSVYPHRDVSAGQADGGGVHGPGDGGAQLHQRVVVVQRAAAAAQ